MKTPSPSPFPVARALLFVAALAAAGPLLAAETTAEPDPLRTRELIHIVRQDCGSCHGLTFAGGLGPALTAEALAGKPAEGLVATIVSGRPGTPMPPFLGIVSEAEAVWIVDQLMRGFPADGGAVPTAQAR